jgi:DNA-binding transcriptional LysR family regulator
MMALEPGSLDDVTVFVEVARHASFIEAARRLRRPPSSVSRAVARLERSVGVRLLQRTSRKVALTEEGNQLFLRAAGLVEELGYALGEVSDRRTEPSGTIRVTAPAYTGATRAASALAAFARAHPRVNIELDASNAIRDLLADGYDLALRVGPLADGDHMAQRLWEAPFGLYASPDLLARTRRDRQPLTRAALERAPAVVTRRTGTWRFRLPNGTTTEVTPNPRFSVNDPRAALEVARHGIGFVVAPADAIPPHDRTLLSVPTTLGSPLPAVIHAVYPTHRLQPHRVRLLLAWLKGEKE